jgi:hypothetical protein
LLRHTKAERIGRTGVAADQRGPVPAMKIFLLNLFGTPFIVVEQPGPLSRRLAALRAWPSRRNFPLRQ